MGARRNQLFPLKLAGLFVSLLLVSVFLSATGPQEGSQQKGKKDEVKGDAAKGKQVFEADCSGCHEISDKDDKVGPGLKGISKKGSHTLADGTVHKDHSPATLRKELVEGAGAMHAVGKTLSEKELNDVVAYLLML
jgi:mono/diheme cytochrome c family protein